MTMTHAQSGKACPKKSKENKAVQLENQKVDPIAPFSTLLGCGGKTNHVHINVTAASPLLLHCHWPSIQPTYYVHL